MSDKVTVILAKASWCHYCTKFSPIFEAAEKNIKSESYFKNKDITFETYDLAEEQGKKNIFAKYPEAQLFIQGYPTVCVKTTVNGKDRMFQVDHTAIDVNKNMKEDKLLHDAAKRFNKNIISKLMSNEQNGGDTYIKKYLKYKHKYLSLKNKM